MKSWIDKLSGIADRRKRTILGLMSGTSMDGIDMALCRVEGSSLQTKLEILHYQTLSLDKSLQRTFTELAFKEDAPLAQVLRFERELTDVWCGKIQSALDEWGMKKDEVDLLASHGQTILHLPDSNHSQHMSFQIVDGDLLAQGLGIITVSDFRRKHLAAGYEGAPLAPLAETLLFTDTDENRVLLNLGGIANFTFLEAGRQQVTIPFATDTGPANTLMDAAVRHLVHGKSFDEEGALARSGQVNELLMTGLMDHPFFDRNFPKSTGQEEFNWDWVHQIMLEQTPDIEIRDLLATLTDFTIRTVSEAIQQNVKENDYKVYVSGGGWQNRYLIKRMKSRLQKNEIVSSRKLGLDPDAKEAALFAVLANETVAGDGWENRSGKRFTLGKISLPGV